MLKLIKEDNKQIKEREQVENQQPEINMNNEKPIEEIKNKSELVMKAIVDSINNLIQNSWNCINEINSVSATMDFDYKESNKDDVKEILNQIIDDTTINIGMLHKVIELVDNKTSKLLDNGLDKAEKILDK